VLVSLTVLSAVVRLRQEAFPLTLAKTEPHRRNSRNPCSARAFPTQDHVTSGKIRRALLREIAHYGSNPKAPAYAER
jgi:hypothetical protein